MDLTLALALSTHVFFERDYNEVHPHIQLEYDNHTYGLYYNSVENISAYAAKKFTLTENTSLEIGGATGYYDELFVPFARYSYEKHNIKYFVTPAPEVVNGDKRVGLVFGIEFSVF